MLSLNYEKFFALSYHHYFESTLSQGTYQPLGYAEKIFLCFKHNGISKF